MLHENEGKAMTATRICACGPSRRNMFASSIRAIKPGACVGQIHWLQMLLVVLLAGQVSCDYTFLSPLAAVIPSTTTVQPFSYYYVDVTVDVKGRKMDESEIKDWLSQVFTESLGSCVSTSPTETTTLPPTTPASTPAATTPTTTATTDPSTKAPTPPKNNTTPSFPFTSKVTKTLPAVAVTPSESIKKRVARQASTSSKAAGIFQAIDVSCDIKTDIRHTTCSVLLQLRQPVPACCILSILCAASKASKEIQAVGTKAGRLESGCTSKPPVETNCVYKGPTSPSCEESGAGYVVQNDSPDCGPVVEPENRNCSCSTYCSRTDAYYTFQVLVHDPLLRFSEMFSMITTISTAPICTSSSEFLCTPPIIASQYKGANMTCEGALTNLASCRVILAFASDVPICNVSAAVINVVQADRRISFSGQVTQAAICGNDSSNPLTTQATWETSDPRPETVCLPTGNPVVYPCQKGKNVVVGLRNQCVVVPITTPRPNVTTMKPNTTTSPLNMTTPPLNTTTPPLNTTTPPLNTTAEPLNATTTTASVTVNTTVNTTATTANVSVTMNTTLNATATTANVSVTANTTLNTTATPANVTANMTTADNESDEALAYALLAMTADVSKLNASQVAWLVSQLEKLVSRPNVSLIVGNISVHIVSNLLGASPMVLAPSARRIIGVVDTLGLKLVLKDKAETLTFSALALSVKPADGSNFKETVFTITDPSNIQVRVDPRLTRSVEADASIPQGSIILPPSITQSLTPEEQKQVSRVQFSFYQKSTVFQDKSLGQRILNSGILAASVANLSISGLKDNVTIQLKNTKTIPNGSVPVCVFWDFTFNEGSGGWNSEGCSLQNTTHNVTVCGCNHLTSFAILLDLARQPLASQVHNTILTFITYIGCGISAIFLSVTLLTYLAFGKLRKDIPSKILIQLCLALLLLNLVFLVDAWLALYPDAVGLCISTAWFLHYFLLVSFTWMGLEAVHMYLALVKVFNSHISHYMLRFSAAGWGIPMIVVIIVIAIDKDNYGLVSYGKFADGTTDDFCWLKNDIAFYVAVVAYFCVIFLFNIVMFIVVLVQLCRIKRQNPHNVQHRTTLQDVRSVMGITILLGLTWGFAFFAWGPVNLAFMYLFAIFNSLQGFLIFVFHCAVKENVRRQWRTYLCCGRMRLAENSEWSRTATQKNVKSSLTATHYSRSSQSNNSSSSFFLGSDISEPVNGVGSPFEDRTITADEDPSMDVVLNEINSQFRHQHDS